MARAIRLGVEGGRLAYRAGPDPAPPARAGVDARGRGRGVLSARDALFDGWERAWSGRDPAAFAPLCDPDVHYEDPLHRRAAARRGRDRARAPRGCGRRSPTRGCSRPGRGSPTARTRARRRSCSARTASRSRGSRRRTASSSCTSSSSPSCATSGCSACARSSTSTAPRSRSACCRGRGRSASKALLLLRGFGLRAQGLTPRRERDAGERDRAAGQRDRGAAARRATASRALNATTGTA